MDRKLQIKQWLKEILDMNLSGFNYQAFIFGSQANKTELSRSDIDLGLLCDTNIPLENISRIHIAIEQLPMLFNVDVVDFYDVDQTFKNVALNNVEYL